MAEAFRMMGEYSKALPLYEKALGIQKTILPSNHPDLGACYNNIGLVYYNMGDYLKAMSCCAHAVDILQISYPPSHPLVRQFKNNCELIKKNL